MVIVRRVCILRWLWCCWYFEAFSLRIPDP